jgi:hypothetical protein
MRFVTTLVAIGMAACGAEGPPGEDGEDGLDGRDGLDGTDNRIEESIFCTGLLESTTLYFSYHAAVTTAGDIFSSGAIRDAVEETGASSYFSAGQNGAATAPVVFTADAYGSATGGWWRLSLDRTTLVASIEYNDTEMPGGQDVWTMPATACTRYATP